MTTPLNRGDGASFFATQHQSPDGADLVSSQIDPTQPQVQGLSLVSDPLLPDRMVRDRMVNFDPSLFDLRDTSHLMRLMKALLGAAGAGGLRKQSVLRRLGAGSISGANFLDLDGFWGALYGVSRMSNETLVADPSASVDDQDGWDQVASRDGQYRSRITQFAKAVGQGATYYGLVAAAEALLGVEVDLIESWTLADQVAPGTIPSVLNGDSYFVVKSKYGSYGNMIGNTWGALTGGQVAPGQTPLGNRGEIILRPKRSISQEEKRHVSMVLDTLKPAGTLITVLETGEDIQQPVLARSAWADSEHWDVISLVTPRTDLLSSVDIYPGTGAFENGRPAFSQYSGESWSYNSRISAVSSYQMVDGATVVNEDYQTITYLDGQSHAYLPADSVMSAHQTAISRAASEGVLTVYPFAEASQ